MGNEDHGERLAKLEVETANIKERIGKIEKGVWAMVLTIGSYIVTQVMKGLNLQ